MLNIFPPTLTWHYKSIIRIKLENLWMCRDETHSPGHPVGQRRKQEGNQQYFERNENGNAT